MLAYGDTVLGPHTLWQRQMLVIRLYAYHLFPWYRRWQVHIVTVLERTSVKYLQMHKTNVTNIASQYMPKNSMFWNTRKQIHSIVIKKIYIWRASSKLTKQCAMRTDGTPCAVFFLFILFTFLYIYFHFSCGVYDVCCCDANLVNMDPGFFAIIWFV